MKHYSNANLSHYVKRNSKPPDDTNDDNVNNENIINLDKYKFIPKLRDGDAEVHDETGAAVEDTKGVSHGGVFIKYIDDADKVHDNESLPALEPMGTGSTVTCGYTKSIQTSLVSF